MAFGLKAHTDGCLINEWEWFRMNWAGAVLHSFAMSLTTDVACNRNQQLLKKNLIHIIFTILKHSNSCCCKLLSPFNVGFNRELVNVIGERICGSAIICNKHWICHLESWCERGNHLHICITREPCGKVFFPI